MKAINPFSSMAAGANTFFAAIENDIQSGVKNADDEAQVGTTIEALAVGTTSEVLATDREALAGSAEANDAEPAVHETTTTTATTFKTVRVICCGLSHVPSQITTGACNDSEQIRIVAL